MKFKRILSVLLACLMLTGALAVGANAWTAPEEKTKASYAIPLVGKWLAWPGEMIVTKLVLPQVLKLLNLDLASMLPLDNIISKDVIEGLVGSLGDLPEPFDGLFASLAPGLNTALNGVNNTATFASALALALRPVLIIAKLNPLPAGLVLPVGDIGTAIANDYDTLAAALKALGAPGVKAKADITAANNAAGAAAQKVGAWLQALETVPTTPMPTFTAAELAPIDALITGLVSPLFGALESIMADPLALIFEKLPNLLYNRDKIAALLTSSLVTDLGGMLGGLDLSSFAAYITNLDEVVEDMLAGILGELGLDLDVAGLIEKLTFAGDLNADGVVVADKSLVYNIFVNFLWNSIKDNKAVIVDLLAGLVPQVPKFLWSIVYYLVRALAWMFRI